MGRGVEPATVEIEAELLHEPSAELHLPVPVVASLQERGGIVDRIQDGIDDWFQPIDEVVEHDLHLGGQHPGLELVEERVVTFSVPPQRIRFLLLEVDQLLQVGLEDGEIVGGARLGPCLIRAPRDTARALTSSSGTFVAFA